MKSGKVTMFLRLEGLVIAVLAIILYADANLSWWWFGIGLILPDISMVGYMVNNKIGALIYNIGHSLVLPLTVSGLGFWTAPKGVLALGLAWTVHVGLDRMLGFGLKTDEGFKHTHLGKITKF